MEPKRLPSGKTVGEPRLWLQHIPSPGLMLSRCVWRSIANICMRSYHAKPHALDACLRIIWIKTVPPWCCVAPRQTMCLRSALVLVLQLAKE